MSFHYSRVYISGRNRICLYRWFDYLKSNDIIDHRNVEVKKNIYCMDTSKTYRERAEAHLKTKLPRKTFYAMFDLCKLFS